MVDSVYTKNPIGVTSATEMSVGFGVARDVTYTARAQSRTEKGGGGLTRCSGTALIAFRRVEGAARVHAWRGRSSALSFVSLTRRVITSLPIRFVPFAI